LRTHSRPGLFALVLAGPVGAKPVAVKHPNLLLDGDEIEQVTSAK
jgi:hypothetical protein